LGGHPDTDPTRAWPARQAGFDPIEPRVNKMSPAQNLVRFRHFAGATKAGTRNSRLWLHPGWRRDLREDVAVVRWTLHRQEAALAAAHHVEGYAHASRKDFGVMAGSLLGHDWLLPINNAAARLP